MPKVIKLSSASRVSMSDELYELSNSDHFWFQWRFNAVMKQLAHRISKENRILEIGCGNGVVMKQFEDFLGKPIEGCDLNSFAIENLIPDLPGTVYLYDIYDEHPSLLNKFDVIILFDVIEHIKNDSDFLRQSVKHLKKDGLIVISVPAQSFLFSEFDTLVGHIRRYDARSMHTLLDKLDVSIVDIRYWGLSLFPIVLLRKLFMKLFQSQASVKKGFKPPSNYINKVFKLAMKFEVKYITKPIIGASLLAIAKKS